MTAESPAAEHLIQDDLPRLRSTLPIFLQLGSLLQRLQARREEKEVLENTE